MLCDHTLGKFLNAFFSVIIQHHPHAVPNQYVFLSSVEKCLCVKIINQVQFSLDLKQTLKFFLLCSAKERMSGLEQYKGE